MHDMQPATIPLLFTSFLLLSAAASETPRSAAEPTFAIANDRFVLNGTEVSVLSPSLAAAYTTSAFTHRCGVD